MLVSDRALAPGDPDVLDLGAIAAGLSRFIRNENTQPPLTVAVKGPWGSGKSSLMNLLLGDLARYGFRPVWFNAWHHQKEESLLAALLEGIREQAVHPWWHPAGLAVRFRLLALRTRRHGPLVIASLVLLAVACAYLLARPDHLAAVQEHPARIIESIAGIFGESPEPGPAETDTSEAAPDVLKVVLPPALAALLLMIWRGMMAFGVKPAVLLTTLKRNVRVRDLQAKTSFRYRFAREFDEVTHALQPRSMVILIDDLDRCRPENVMEILEAVNFLASSGECFIILGMELARVEQYIDQYFEDIQEPDFARHYLEKLINIEVPVPAPDPEQSKALIMPPESVLAQNGQQGKVQQGEEKSKRKVSSERIERVLRIAGRAAVLLLPVVAFCVTFWLMDTESLSNTMTAATASAGGAETTAVTSSGTPGTGPSPSTGEEARLTEEYRTPALLQKGAASQMPVWLFVLPLVLLLGLGLWRLSIPPNMIVKDSQAFVDALKIWHDVIMARSKTPRSAKRFVNRVRYYAMQQREQPAPVSFPERVWRGL